MDFALCKYAKNFWNDIKPDRFIEKLQKTYQV